MAPQITIQRINTVADSNSTAIAAVLNTAELLENVLLRVDPARMVFTMQRVSALWQNVITHSIKIKRMLFLIPIGEYATRFIGLARSEGEDFFPIPTYTEGALALNDQKIHRSLSPMTRKSVSHRRIRQWVEGRLQGECRIDNDIGPDQQRVRFTWTEGAYPRINGGKGDNLESRGFDNKSASWRRMFLTQPPCTWVRLHLKFTPSVSPVPLDFFRRSRLQRYGIVLSNGVTLGDLFDRLEDLVHKMWMESQGSPLPRAENFLLSMTWCILEAKPEHEPDTVLEPPTEENSHIRTFDGKYGLQYTT
ncbi:hypothetical protein W97_02709 [Coniosporium apollinis CBS 100218]|uniref:F-box domain-containing protein n=1 Tax=Coniosporium apollinis (strain CBS 100218) TaxID=1168221 RepID=R7YP82_CONA1|nr:uncharacterized protein W97_02709 [Coniosporium apollinis CBS 100218]EON63481.1 hypothetical protein W97_02709 [Coniosporium apollinis CBS 100218]